MTSAPPEGSPVAATMTMITMRPSAGSFPSDATSNASITTDFLALVGFAARLGTCVNNDASSDTEDGDGQDAKSVRDEAMLLMSLLMGKKAEEILSEEIGAKESRCQKRKNRGLQLQRGGRWKSDHDQDMGNFSFTFPSLSLQPDAADPMDTASSEEEWGRGEAPREDGDDDLPPPSKLLSRTQSVTDKDAIRDSSEAMAHNVLESFGAALVWRAKTWIKSLANVLALKEQERINAFKAASAATEGEGHVSSGDDMEANQGEEGEDEEVKKGTGMCSQEFDNENDDLINTKEMQIIDAIVKSSEEVSVVNVKTAFRVLPNRVSIRDQEQETSPKKKAKMTTGPSSPRGKIKEYNVTHKLVFEATISMTSNDGVRYNGVKLQTPGYIQGTFFTNPSPSKVAEGDETLSRVSITLDTDSLALSLERQSRLVVRRAAEAALMAASGIDCNSSPHYMESPHVHHSIISPRYVLMSPVPAYPTTMCATHDPSMPLPSVPSANALNGEDGGAPLNKDATAVVSSSEGHSSDSSAVSATTTPVLSPTEKRSADPSQSPSLPALLSVANEELSRGIE